MLWIMKTTRRSLSTLRFKQELPLQLQDPLTRGFKALHEYLLTFNDIAEVDSLKFLIPFLSVIKSHQTNAEITAAALAALDKFLLYGFILPDVRQKYVL